MKNHEKGHKFYRMLPNLHLSIFFNGCESQSLTQNKKYPLTSHTRIMIFTTLLEEQMDDKTRTKDILSNISCGPFCIKKKGLFLS